ncbi:MAG: DNA gyrase subunit A [Cyclobacteriaceae bacterium]
MSEGDIENTSASGGNIIPINIEDEMKGAYIDYSMSVIISRALPDARDGLKPVHRRILYGMDELGVNYNKPYKKCARIVGDVLGKYHPHGDTAVYDTMVRMAQEWSLRYPLVDGQGNFGSVDGDSPAAMRYTEARLKRISEEMLADINKNTVDYQPNYDDSTKEPTVLPAKFPNLLLNGASGIAVGMATNMAPHNLTEVINGVIAYIDDRDITIEGLMQYVTAPDFPTGATIYGYQGVRQAYETGRGRVVLRARAEIEETKSGREQIIVTEIPYQVNKAAMIEKTAQLINEKKIEGISDIRDESDRNGMRIVYELKRDSIPNIVLNTLYKYTQLQSSFSINNVALVKGRPKTLNLKELIYHYVEHRHEVVIRRTQYELEEAEKRAHILEGYLIALDNLDEVIDLIRKSKDPEAAKTGLIDKFKLSEIQAKAILEMRLQRLTGMERDKIVQEYEEIKLLIEKLQGILANEDQRMDIIKEELNAVVERYGDDRRTDIEHAADDFTAEDMIPDEDMVLTISHEGYIKRTALVEYRTQGRGGVGSRAVKSKDDDFTEHLFVASAHNYLLIFTEFGKVFWKKVWEIPEGSKTSKGRAIQNLINIESEDNIRAVINVKTLTDPDYINNNFLVMCTKNGTIKKTSLEAYSRPRQNGINAITIHEGDKLLEVKLTNGNYQVVIANNAGRAIHFNEGDVRSMGRTAAGVRGIWLNKDEHVVGMVCVDMEEAPNLLVVSENGYGKRSELGDYRITKRGGKGVKTMNITDKTGALVALKDVKDEDDLMIINKSGIAIRMAISQLRVMGRATQGVKLIKLGDDDQISAVEKIEFVPSDDSDETTDGEDQVNSADDSGEAPEASTENTEE